MNLSELHQPTREGARPLKRSMSGYETELFVLDSNGRLDNSDQLLKQARAAKLSVEPECAKAMIEVLCLPFKRLRSANQNLAQNLLQLSELAEREGRALYPFATYPGLNKPAFRKKAWYQVQRQILGDENFENAGKCCGYHQHYALPRGTFDAKTKTLSYRTNSKVKRTLLDSYNFLIAADPVFTTLLQSSPYADGRFLAKDSRLLLYRGGEKLKYRKGVYAKHQFFGGLSPYKQTLGDLISTIKRRHRKWHRLVEKQGHALKEHELKSCWNPVKVNPKGTLEYRGGDMNYLSNIFAASTMLKFALRKIQQDFTLVTPMDIELRDAFKVEGNLMFIPPHSIVRKHLQRAAAYEGLKHPDVLAYVRAFDRFIRRIVYPNYRKMLEPARRMLARKRTVSDEMLTRAKRMGFGDTLGEEEAARLALKYGEEFRKDLKKVNANLDEIPD